jgi:hypothetical protein
MNNKEWPKVTVDLWCEVASDWPQLVQVIEQVRPRVRNQLWLQVAEQIKDEYDEQ